MTVQSGQSITVLFTTRVFSTGVATNATGTPTGTLYVNGVSNAAAVTVTNVTTGIYTAQVTLPTLAIKDEVQIIINATVSGVTDNGVIWTDTKDILLDASGDVTFNNTTITTVTGNVNGSVGSVTGAVGSVTAGVTVTTNNDKTSYSLAAAYDFAKGTVAMTESYAAQGATMTPAQAFYMINQFLGQHSTAATTWTVKKRDGSTTAKTYTLDSAVSPTSITEAT